VTNPFSLSLTTLKAKAQSLPFADGIIYSNLPVDAFVALTEMFSGEGKYLIILSNKG